MTEIPKSITVTCPNCDKKVVTSEDSYLTGICTCHSCGIPFNKHLGLRSSENNKNADLRSCSTCRKIINIDKDLHLDLENGNDQTWYFCSKCAKEQFSSDSELIKVIEEIEKEKL